MTLVTAGRLGHIFKVYIWSAGSMWCGLAIDRPAPATDGLCPSVVAPAGPSRLFRKYAALLVAVASAALAGNGALEIWFSYPEQKNFFFRIQHE